MVNRFILLQSVAKVMPMMDLPNMRGTKTEVKILLRFNRSTKFLTAQHKAKGVELDTVEEGVFPQFDIN